MNIRHRITLLVVLTFLAIAAIGGFAVFQSRGSASEVRMVTQGVVPSALASAELVGQLKDVQLSVMMIVAAPDLKLAEQAGEKLLANQAVLQKALDLQMSQADSVAQRGLVEQAKESLANYFAAIKDTAGFKLSGQTAVAEANLAANVGGYLQEMEQIIETLQIEKRRSKDGAIQSLNENLVGTTTTIAVVTVVAILVLTVMGVLLYRQITRPISEMEAKMTEIATSQDFTHRVPVKRMDEIGRSLTAFNAMVQKIQESSELVKQKTADIHAMLHYIPQGILTIEAGNTIHPEYSEFLESILETKVIAGHNLMEVIFANTQCNADILSQIEAATGACIGEDAMNFEFNAHLLVAEIRKNMPDGRVKILDLNWSPITDEQGTTLRILLCLRDVTDLRALAFEAHEQKRELAIIGEILSVQQEKFHKFIHGALQFVSENRQLIAQAPVEFIGAVRTDTITQLFRNMHTIKGNARTYGLLYLTHVVHEAEQTYDELRHNPEQVWDAALLLMQLDSTQHALDEYTKINEVKLGRKGPGRRGGVDKFLMVENDHIEATINLLDNADSTSVVSLRDVLRQTRHSLEVIGTEKVENILAGVLESLPSLAKELGKESPGSAIQDNGILVRTQIADLLRNVYMHLYRNAVDHGIETAVQRVASGKAPAGRIELWLEIQGDDLVLSLEDDGQGLAVDSIRKKALEKSLIVHGDACSAEEIAQLIFMPGFSTADHVTEVSGRGVGMDAVKGFVQAQGGSIELVLAGADGQGDYRPFETVIRLPAKFAVAPVLRLLQQIA